MKTQFFQNIYKDGITIMHYIFDVWSLKLNIFDTEILLNNFTDQYHVNRIERELSLMHCIFEEENDCFYSVIFRQILAEAKTHLINSDVKAAAHGL